MKVLLIQHVEKIVLLLVLVLCGLWINGLLSNPKTLPDKDAAKPKIDQWIKEVKAAVAETPPSPEKPMDYTGVIQNRLSVEVGFADTLQWLTAHPDIVEGSTGSKNVFSIYQVLTPTVSVEDEVGSILVSVALPSDSGRGDEVKGGSEANWERELPNKDVVKNHGRWLGVRVEFKSGTNGKWLALRSAGRNGTYLFKQGDYSLPEFRHTGVQGKQQYSYRACLLVAATGINEEGLSEVGQETIVFNGEYRGPIDRKAWANANGKLNGRILPLEAAALPPGVKLAEGEKAYQGDFGTAGVIEQAESDMIMAVKQIGGFGEEVTLRLYMMKMIRDIRGEIMGWTEPEEFKDIKIGDKLGGPDRRVKIRGRENLGFTLVDFSSEWVLQDMNMEGRRIFYYEVKKVSVPKDETYPEGVKLELREKAKTNTHVIKINNGIETIELIRLERNVSIPQRVMKYCYPLLPGNAEKFEELDSFLNGDPLEFVQPILEPEKPVEKPPTDLPPVDVDLGEKPFQTNIPYYVFPDNRVVFWDHVNKELRILGKEPEAPQEDPELPAGAEGAEGVEGADGGAGQDGENQGNPNGQ